MAHKKKENKNKKRKPPIPPVSVHKTKKRREIERKWRYVRQSKTD
jgi:hypothetical protein